MAQKLTAVHTHTHARTHTRSHSCLLSCFRFLFVFFCVALLETCRRAPDLNTIRDFSCSSLLYADRIPGVFALSFRNLIEGRLQGGCFLDLNRLRDAYLSLAFIQRQSGSSLIVAQAVAPVIYDTIRPVDGFLAYVFPMLAASLDGNLPSGLNVTKDEIAPDNVMFSHDRVVPMLPRALLAAFDILSLHPSKRLVAVDETRVYLVCFTMSQHTKRVISSRVSTCFGPGNNDVEIINTWAEANECRANYQARRRGTGILSLSLSLSVCVCLSLSLLLYVCLCVGVGGCVCVTSLSLFHFMFVMFSTDTHSTSTSSSLSSSTSSSLASSSLNGVFVIVFVFLL